jgi:hypothetical protein
MGVSHSLPFSGHKKAALWLPFAGSCCKGFYLPKKKNIFLFGW